MKITERSYIQTPPEKVWPYLISPEHFQEWNDKIVSMEARGTFVLNQPFVTHYRLGKQSSQCLSTVVAIEPLRLLELHHRAVATGRDGASLEAVERITLAPRGAASVVTKTVWIRNHHIPWLLVPLIWFVTHFGSRAGRDKLKDLCERV